jgi:hypothetical protein
MSLDQSLVAATSVLISGFIGALTFWLSVRKRLEEEALGKATRKTTAMQLLSDEEFTLEQVRDECVAIDTIVQLGEFGRSRIYLIGEVERIKAEASEMLSEVYMRRKSVEKSLPLLNVSELETVIVTAYHGKRRAEAQLVRTRLSRTEVLSRFSAHSKVQPALKPDVSASGRSADEAGV